MQTMDETTRNIILLLLTAILLSIIVWLIAPPANAITITVAKGDNLSFTGHDAPFYITIPSSEIQDGNVTTETVAEYLNQTKEGQAWIFGPRDSLYPIPFTIRQSNYSFYLTQDQVHGLEPEAYSIYFQVPGKSGLDVTYDNLTDSLVPPTRYQKTVPLTGLSPRLVETALRDMRVRYASDITDIMIQHTLSIETPKVQVRDNYDTENGDLYIGGTTNLAVGDVISGTIDPDVYADAYYNKLMTSTHQVYGGDASMRYWNLTFSHKLAPQLISGHHTIVINLGQGVMTTASFNKATVTIPPTPTPQTKDVYSVSGEWMGTQVNTTRPVKNVTITPTPVPTPTRETVLAPERLNNREVPNRGTVYIGEKNLDVFGAIGYMDSITGEFTIQYCDIFNSSDYGRTMIVKTPRHFDIDPAAFGADYGAWCQYSKAEDGVTKQPVAFFVNQLPANVTFPTPIPTITNTTNITAANLTENVTVTETPTPEPTTIPTEPTPEPTETIAVPLNPAIGVLAIGVIAAIWRKKK